MPTDIPTGSASKIGFSMYSVQKPHFIWSQKKFHGRKRRKFRKHRKDQQLCRDATAKGTVQPYEKDDHHIIRWSFFFSVVLPQENPGVVTCGAGVKSLKTEKSRVFQPDFLSVLKAFEVFFLLMKYYIVLQAPFLINLCLLILQLLSGNSKFSHVHLLLNPL